MSTDLRTAITEHVERVPVPPGDLAAVVRQGRAVRARRRATGLASLAAAVALTAAVGTQVVRTGDDGRDLGQAADPAIGDVADGLRAYADPGVVLHYAGRTVSATGLEGLDTDAVATSYGVVLYDGYRPILLGLDGGTEYLLEDTRSFVSDFRPTAKADATSSEVVVGVSRGASLELVVVDLRTREERASARVECRAACAEGIVIEAFDDGVVFYRDETGTKAWDVRRGTIDQLAGPGTRIADVRGGTVLYDGPQPSPEVGTRLRHYRLVPAGIDSQLTHDGGYVLAWSSTLQATGGGRPLQLDVTEEDGATHWSIDSDGSVLVASRAGATTRIHDCDARTGACDLVDELEITGGDPLFLGSDG